jgi:hypothetical protein
MRYVQERIRQLKYKKLARFERVYNCLPFIGICLLLISLAACNKDSQENSLSKTIEVKDNRATYPTLFKLNDQLILQIPPEYLGTRSSGLGVTPPSPSVDKLQKVDFALFHMFLPDFGGYTAENWGEFDAGTNKIDIQQVRIVEKEKIELFNKEHILQNIESSKRNKHFDLVPENKYGLQCYKWTKSEDVTCYGERETGGLIEISILWMAPGKFRLVGYSFMKRWGGVRVQWSADPSSLSSWMAIDEHIWKYINDWNIAKAPSSNN